MTLTTKFALFTSLLSLSIIAGLTFFAYHNAYRELETSLGMRLEAVVRSGALGIDGSAHDTIRGMDDVADEAFQSIRHHLRQLKEANDLKEAIYTLRRRGETLEFVVMTNEKPFVGDTYSIRRAMLPTLNEGKPAHTGVYSDTHGEWISAYAPIFDRNGQISGLLEADIHVEEFLATLRGKFIVLVEIGLAFAVLAVLGSLLLAKGVTRKLNYLTDVTEKISLGKMDTPIQVQGKDEVAKLGQSLERMRESLRLAAEMFK